MKLTIIRGHVDEARRSASGRGDGNGMMARHAVPIYIIYILYVLYIIYIMYMYASFYACGAGF